MVVSHWPTRALIWNSARMAGRAEVSMFWLREPRKAPVMSTGIIHRPLRSPMEPTPLRTVELL